MKKQKDPIQTRLGIAIVIVVALIALALMCTDGRADGIGYSRDGWEGSVLWPLDQHCDSGWWIYKHVSSGLTRDTAHLYPFDVTDSTKLAGTDLLLDSIGWYKVQMCAWIQGSPVSLIRDTGSWFHEGPGRIVPASPSGSYLCRLYGNLSDLGANYVQNAIVTAKLEPQNVYDTCAKMLVFDREKKTTPTGTDGYFQIDLTRSSCIGGVKYTITVSKPRLPDVTYKVTIPDSTTYKMTWGR